MKQVAREEALCIQANASVKKKVLTNFDGAINSNRWLKYSWRDDPRVSLSDWTILVKQGDGTRVLYHVHSNVFEQHAKEDSYFSILFQQNDSREQFFSEQKSHALELVLDPLAASAFPTFLDYVYEITSKLEIRTISATALLYLGDYFGMDQVQKIAKKYISLDMSLDTIGMYAEQCKNIWPYECIHEILADFVAKNLTMICRTHPCVPNLALDVWNKIPEKCKLKQNESLCMHFTLLFAEFARGQSWQENADVFHDILSVDSVPFIHPDAALILAELDAKFPLLASRSLPSPLLERCFKTLPMSESFQKKILRGDGEVFDRLEKLPMYFSLKVCKMVMEESTKHSARLMRMKSDLLAELYKDDRQTVLKKAEAMEKKRREELDAQVKKLLLAIPDISVHDARQFPQYAEVEKVYDMQREVFDEVVESKLPHQSIQAATKRRKTVASVPVTKTVAAKQVNNREDPYPVGREFFVRDVEDGFGGHEYPAIIIEPTNNTPNGFRRIRFKGYGCKHNKDVHVSELLKSTKERRKIFKNETIPSLERNMEWVKELQQSQGEVSTAQGSIDKFVVGGEYFFPKKGVEYPVILKSICPRATHKGKIKFTHCGSLQKTPVELRCLVPATKARKDKFHDLITEESIKKKRKSKATATTSSKKRKGYRLGGGSHNTNGFTA